MTEQRQPAINIKATARLAGLLYLIIIVIGVLGESVIRGKLVVSGDPEATARSILAAEWLWRLGVGAQDLLLLCAVGLTLLWYILLRPVNQHLAQAVAFFGLVSLAVESVSALHLHAVLTPLNGSAYLNVIDPRQLADAIGRCLLPGQQLRHDSLSTVAERAVPRHFAALLHRRERVLPVSADQGRRRGGLAAPCRRRHAGRLIHRRPGSGFRHGSYVMFVA